jgi:septal ring-binding cell division protein DamX
MIRLNVFLFSTLLLSFAGNAATDLVDAGFQAFKQQRWSDAYEYWIPEADKGNARAQFYLSILLEEGLGAEQDEITALTLLLLSAEGGFPPAQFRLGTNYQFGHWVERDMQQAIDWWLKAADSGFVKAQLNLGSVYYLGKGTEVDLQKSVAWYRRAALNGSEQAIGTLKRMGADLAPAASRDATETATGLTIAQQDAVLRRANQSLQPSQGLYGYQEKLERYTTASEPFLVTPAVSKPPQPGPAAVPVATPAESKAITASPPEKNSAVSQQVTIAFAPVAGIKGDRIDDSSPQRSLLELARVNQEEKIWIKRQPVENYTLQLFSSNKYESAQRFANELNTRRPKAIYPFGRAENIWYGVIVGSYSTKLALQAARKEFAVNQGIKNPWIRRFEDINRDAIVN